MPVTARNLAWTADMLNRRVGAPYVYGGVLSPTNLRQGCDCSALYAHILNGALFGDRMTWQRIDPTNGGAWVTTESWRPIRTGQRGPFGTITVASPRDIPADAAVKIALHHGPGGGANSHMWGELAGVRYESAGGKGLVTGPAARAITDPYGTDWAYLPAPADAGPPPPTPHTYTVRSGDTLGSIAGRYGLDWREIGRLNAHQNPDPHSIYPGQVLFLTERRWPEDYTDRELLIDLARQIRGPAGKGWPQLGNRTLVDGVAALLEQLPPF